MTSQFVFLRNKLIAILLPMLFVLLGTFAVQATTTITVQPTSPSIKTGAEASFLVTIHNGGSVQQVVSLNWYGNVTVISATRNGVRLNLRSAQIVFDDDLFSALRASLKPLPAGREERFNYVTERDPVTGAQSIVTVARLPSLQYRASYWAIEAPGKYVFSLRYQYTAGTKTPTSSLLTQPLYARVSFEVRP